jgi:DNA-binding XRE family transcriptional regulator
MKLENLVEAVGWTQTTLADRADISRTTLWKCQTQKGCRKNERQLIALALSAALKTSIHWEDLLDRESLLKLHPHELPAAGECYSVALCMNFRGNPELTRYYRKALSDGGHMYYLSVMSKNSIATDHHVDTYLKPETKLTVFAWKPETTSEIIGCAKHERADFDPVIDGEGKIRQVQMAILGWGKRAARNSNIEVFTYDWMPAFQGYLLEAKWAVLEFMTYDSDTKYRPGLLLRHHELHEQRPFDNFTEQFHRIAEKTKHSPWKVKVAEDGSWDLVEGVRPKWFSADVKITLP